MLKGGRILFISGLKTKQFYLNAPVLYLVTLLLIALLVTPVGYLFYSFNQNKQLEAKILLLSSQNQILKDKANLITSTLLDIDHKKNNLTNQLSNTELQAVNVLSTDESIQGAYKLAQDKFNEKLIDKNIQILADAASYSIKNKEKAMEILNKYKGKENFAISFDTTNTTFSKDRIGIGGIDSLDEKLRTLIELEEIASEIPLGPPMQYDRISSPYGTRTHPITQDKRKHHGIDLVGPMYTNIHATADGVVSYVLKSERGYGNLITISHGKEFQTRYAHLEEIFVKRGEKVTKGQIIGTQGNTGDSTGDHLHYEVNLKKNLFRKKSINPYRYITYNQ